LLETGKPVRVSGMMGPPQEMLEAVREAVAKKPWRAAS
jgi:hypothetical protein